MSGADAGALDAPDMPDFGGSGLWWVAVFLEDRCYGGPEEGGWYFDCGALVTDPDAYETLRTGPAAFVAEADARAYAQKMTQRLPALNEGRRPTWSILSEGIYVIEVIQADTLPRFYPEQRPRYE